MNIKDVWKDAFALARSAHGNGRPFKARNKSLQLAIDIATGDLGDALAAKTPGFVLSLQHLKRGAKRSPWWNASLNCRCVVRPIHEF